MSKNVFASAFSFVIEQDEVPSASEAANNITPTAEGSPGAPTDDLGASMNDAKEIEILKHGAQREMQMVRDLTSWVEKLDGMVEFLNGTGAESIQMHLKRSVADTLFDKMRTSEAKKIARVAKEISALAETFKGYLATAEDPKYRYI